MIRGFFAAKKKPLRKGEAYFYEQTYKPGFVVYGNLSALYVATKL